MVDDLSDVVISEPVPVRYGFEQVWHADIIAKAQGYKPGTGGAALADLLEAIGEAYDSTRHLAGFDSDWLQGCNDPLRIDEIRRLLREGMSIIDVPNEIGDSFARVVASLTKGQPSMQWTWSERRWAEWEDAIAARPMPTTTDLARQFGLSYWGIESMLEEWGVASASKAQKEMLRRAARLYVEFPTATTPMILKRLEREGYDVSLSALRRHRQRFNKQ